MIDYNWKCKRCLITNEAGTTDCAACGCSAYASAEVVDAWDDADKVERIALKKEMERKTVFLLYAPTSIIILIAAGRHFDLMLFLSVAIYFCIKDSFFRFAVIDFWSRTSVLSFNVLGACLYSLKYLTINETFGNIALITYLLFLTGMTWYMFKSKASADFLIRYQQHKRQQQQ